MVNEQTQIPIRLDSSPALMSELAADQLLAGVGRTRAHAAAKRTFDVACAALLLFVFAPPLALIALAIKLDSHGPVFFRVRRIGRHGQPFMMLKFRKMQHDAIGGPLTMHRDPRLTRVGSVLTRTRLDELPQLWDVVCGRMSMIGPRPEDPAFVAMHQSDFQQILAVRPGITGLSQIAYKEEVTIVDATKPVDDYVTRIMPQKLTMDKLYARSWTLRLDFEVIYWTFVTVVLRHPVSVNRVTGAMNIRRRLPAPVIVPTSPASERVVDAVAAPTPATAAVVDAERLAS